LAKQKRKAKAKDKKDKKIDSIKTNILQFIILVVIIIAIIYGAYTTVQLIMRPTDVVMIEKGLISSEESTSGYIIREETLAKGKKDDNSMIHIKMEGERVAKGDIIFRYESAEEEDINKKIEELNTKIQEALEESTDFVSSDIKAINLQIEDKIDGLKYRNDIDEIEEYKKDIINYITKKAQVVGEISPSGGHIKELMDEKKNYQNEIYNGAEYVTAATSGVVSYRIDNLEEVLTADNLDNINKKMLSDLNLKTGQIITSNNETGKVVDNFKCYIACVAKSEEAHEAKVGDRVKIRLANSNEVMATIESIKEEDGEAFLIIFKITKYVEELINYRKINIDIIWWEYSGLKVPNSAIIYDDGLSYVIRNRAGYLDKILVKILEKNQYYSIVDSYSTEELKALGVELSEINSIRKISIYDEVLVDPDIGKVD